MKNGQEQTAIDKTYVYLENYRELERYISGAVSELSQIQGMEKYSALKGQVFLQMIRECRAETEILLEHINAAMESLKEDARAEGEMYKYEALEAVYVKGMKYEEVARAAGCGKNTPKKWCRSMVPRLAVKLFGAKALDCSMEKQEEDKSRTNRTG